MFSSMENRVELGLNRLRKSLHPNPLIMKYPYSRHSKGKAITRSGNDDNRSSNNDSKEQKKLKFVYPGVNYSISYSSNRDTANNIKDNSSNNNNNNSENENEDSTQFVSTGMNFSRTKPVLECVRLKKTHCLATMQLSN